VGLAVIYELDTNHAAYLSRLLNERFRILDGVLTMAHLGKTERKDALTERRVIQTIQKVLVPK
jgi:hypothetical protein